MENNMLLSVSDLNGIIIKDNDTYTLEDNHSLSRLTVSKTILHKNQETTGHLHEKVEEIYHFTSGVGTIEVGQNAYDVSPGDIVLIPDGAFHKVYNNGNEDLVFIAIFEKYDKR